MVLFCFLHLSSLGFPSVQLKHPLLISPIGLSLSEHHSADLCTLNKLINSYLKEIFLTPTHNCTPTCQLCSWLEAITEGYDLCFA
jgi:hypothetical protein